MKGKRILILGGGTMQLPAIRAALSRGWVVNVADGNPDAAGIALCRRFLPVDLRDVDGMIAAARELQETEGLDGVFTAGTDFSYTVARVARALDLPGIDPEVAFAASDKVRMRQVFAEHGVPAPKFFRLAPNEDVRKKVKELSFPLVLKPVDNMGARGVRRVDTCIELEEAIEAAMAQSHSGYVIVEEFIEGPEFSLDAVIDRGEVHITGVADRIIEFSPYFVEMGHTLPSEVEPSLRYRVEETFIEAIRALGIDSGAAKGDVKLSGTRAVVGEVAARLSGGYMSGWTFPYATGVDLTGAALNVAVGLAAGNLEAKKESVSAERAFISIPGRVVSVQGEDEVKALPGVKELFIRVGPGEDVRFPTNNVEKCGNVIAVDKVRERACGAAEAATRSLFVRLEAENRQTAVFLFQKGEGWIRDAFELFVPENVREFQDMPPFLVESGVNTEEERNPEIKVLPLPALHLEDRNDWHGNGLEETVHGALQHTGARFRNSRPDARTGAAADLREAGERAAPPIVLGTIFWTALLRGGLQGAVWSIDTVQKLCRRGVDLDKWWKEVNDENV